MSHEISTADKVLDALRRYNLKQESDHEYRSNRPWSIGSDSLGLAVKIDGPEHGTYYDHVTDEGGSLYELAERLGISTNGRFRAFETKCSYSGLADYAHAHGVEEDVFRAAGWKETVYQGRPALGFPTRNGKRWRFLDGEKPSFKSTPGYKSCWYGLARAVEICRQTNNPLVICNGEPSVIAAQSWGVPACAVTGGEKSNLRDDLLSELKDVWIGAITLAPDCDETGRKMAEGRLPQLESAGYMVRVVDLNGSMGFDLADFCSLHKEKSPDELLKLKPLINSQIDLDQREEKKPDRFTIHWAAEAFEEPPPTEFLVERLITLGSVNLVVGEGGSKKTWAMIDLGVAVARGEAWLEFETRQGVVLFVDEESGPMRFRRRLYEALHGHFADRETPFAYISLVQLNLREPEDENALHLLIESTGACLVIIDALADVMPGADENAVKDVQPLFMALRGIAETTRAAIVIIHHANKMGSYRGSTALKGAVDLMLMIESKPKSNHIKFKIEKARDIEPIEFMAVANFATESGQFWLSPADNTIEQVKLGKAQEYVIRYLAKHGKSLVKEIMDHADTCSSNGARAAIYNLTSLGFTERVDDGGPGEKATYALTEKGKLYARQAGYML